MTAGEEVRLTVPAAPSMIRVARLTAAALASQLDFSFDDVEDVKMAVDELCFALIGTKGRPGDIDLVYRLGDGDLVIEGTGRFGEEVVTPVATDLSLQILDAVVDEHELSGGDGGARFRLRKRRADA